MMLKKHFEKYFMLYLFIFSLIVRCVYTFWIRGEQLIWVGDEGVYGKIAESIYRGQGYAFEGRFYSTRMPLLAVVTALFYFVTGGFSILRAHIFSILAGSTIPVVTYWLAAKISKSKVVPLFAGLYTAIYPFLVHESSLLDTENIFIPVVLVYFYSLLNLEGSLKNKRNLVLNAAACGLLLGILFLTRSTLSLFLLFWTIYLLIKKYPPLNILQAVLIQGLIALILLAPWSILLSQKTGSIGFFTKGTNSALIGGTNPVVIFDQKASGEWVNLDRDFPQVREQIYLLAGKSDSEKSQVLAVVVHYWRDMPLLMFNKFRKLWGFVPKHYTNRNLRDDVIGLVFYGSLLPFLIISLFLRQTKARDLFLLFAVYFSFLTLLTSGTMRFRLPLDPIIIIFVLDFIFNRKYRDA